MAIRINIDNLEKQINLINDCKKQIDNCDFQTVNCFNISKGSPEDKVADSIESINKCACNMANLFANSHSFLEAIKKEYINIEQKAAKVFR